MLTIRFHLDMNLLQLVCHEEAVNILAYITYVLQDDPDARHKMAEHRDSHMGSQAVHLAATTGKKIIVECLLTDYFADPCALTLGN